MKKLSTRNGKELTMIVSDIEFYCSVTGLGDVFIKLNPQPMADHELIRVEITRNGDTYIKLWDFMESRPGVNLTGSQNEHTGFYTGLVFLIPITFNRKSTAIARIRKTIDEGLKYLDAYMDEYYNGEMEDYNEIS